MGQKTKTIINVVGAVVAAALFQTFFLLCLAYFSRYLGQTAYVLILTGGTVVNVAMFVLEIVFYSLGKELVYKSFVTAYVLFDFAAIVLFVLIRTGFLEIVRDKESLERYLEGAGVGMSALFITLQFLQVVILPIPSFVTVAAGTALFGPLRCAIYSLIGILIGSVSAFLIGRYVGHRAVAWLIGRETLDKWLKKVKGKDKLLLSAMFLLPVFPDDVLCFVAGLSSMSLLFFTVVILVSRVLAVFTTCYSISIIPIDTWWGIALWIVFFALICVLFVVLYKKADAIQNWVYKKFHRETRVREGKSAKNTFSVQIVDPDGSIVEKNLPKESSEQDPHSSRKPKR